MELTSAENNNSWKRLEITSADGMRHLHFQFNFSSVDKDEHNGEYKVLTLLMYNALRKIYIKKGLEEFEDKNFYGLIFTDNFSGFHFSIRWAYADSANDALEIVKQTLDYVRSFDVNAYGYEDLELASGQMPRLCAE